LEDEGKEIQCMEDDEIRYYDKYGNYIMSEREEYEEEDDEDDCIDEESDESVDSDEGEIVFDEEAIGKQIKSRRFISLYLTLFFI
jgi:hypothetical protein